MRQGQNNYLLEKFIVLPGVKWCGKWVSNFSIYEFIFTNFVMDVIADKDTIHVKLLVKKKIIVLQIEWEEKILFMLMKLKNFC